MQDLVGRVKTDNRTALADGEATGFVKVLTRPGSDRILGVTIVGAHAGELIAEYVLAMMIAESGGQPRG